MIEKFILINISMLLLYGTYTLLIKHLTFFRLNRFLLLLIPGIAYLLINLRVETIETFSTNYVLPQMIASDQILALSTIENSLDFLEVGLILYASISLLFFILLVSRFIKLYKLLSTSDRRINQHFLVTISENKYASFSFFNYLFINKNDLLKMDEIVAHEDLHRRYSHSLDNVYFEVLKCVFWINPVVYLMHKEIRKLHEYEVDEALLSTSVSTDYIKTLALSNPISTELILTNPYKSNSNLLNRVRMMKKSKSSNRRLINYLAFIPTLVLVMVLLACTEEINHQPDAQSDEQQTIHTKDLTVQAQFKGGNQAMYDYLGQNIVYPEEAKEEGVSGKVFVSFVVRETGKISEVKVMRGVHPLLDAEAIRAISEMPDWLPGEIEGKTVAVSMMLPIQFTLADD